jgi:hypothetical protein
MLLRRREDGRRLIFTSQGKKSNKVNFLSSDPPPISGRAIGLLYSSELYKGKQFVYRHKICKPNAECFLLNTLVNISAVTPGFQRLKESASTRGLYTEYPPAATLGTFFSTRNGGRLLPTGCSV